jgi:hypothetical protein
MKGCSKEPICEHQEEGSNGSGVHMVMNCERRVL